MKLLSSILITFYFGFVLSVSAREKKPEILYFDDITLPDTSMSEQRFWHIMDIIDKDSFGEHEYRMENLCKILRSYRPPDIAMFDLRLQIEMQRLKTYRLFEAMKIICPECGENEFYYFRQIIIAQGSSANESIREIPDLIAELPIPPDPEKWEGMDACVFDGFYYRTRNSFVRLDPTPDAFLGERPSKKEIKKIYPNLIKKYGFKKGAK